MASTCASSPAHTASVASSPSFQSRVKATLANLGGDTSDEGETSPLKVATSKSTTRQPTVMDNANSSTDTESEDDAVLPRGRFASRMQGAAGTKPSPSTKETDDARERVKRMLGLAANAESRPEAEGCAETEQPGSDQDDEIPRQRRGLKSKRQRAATPESPEQTTPAPVSPGLFVSPDPPTRSVQPAPIASDVEEEFPAKPFMNERYKALVAKKKAERLAREAEEAEKRAKRLAAQQTNDDDLADTEDDSNITDDEGGRKLTQRDRPSRKAGKKALEEMNRETQRMSRSLQLAHEAKTKKKISKAALFERFNFKLPGAPEPKQSSSSRPTTPVSAHHSDAEMNDAGTPPSSPPATGKKIEGAIANAPEPTVTAPLVSEDDDLPTLDQVMNAAPKRVKGKDKATAADMVEEQPRQAKRKVRVKFPPVQANQSTIDLDDNDNLEVTGAAKSKMDAVFNSIPAQKAKQSNSLHHLRQLAHLTSPSKDNKSRRETCMTTGELQINLQQRARLQAKLERERRLEMLKAKGIHVQTAEEREKEMAEVDDIVARARQEAEEIMQREREAAKKEKKESGEKDPLAWDDSDDDSYDGAKDNISEIELSGSEDEEGSGEEESDADGNDGGEEQTATIAMFDDEVESADESADEKVLGPDDVADNMPDAEDDDAELPARPKRRSKKHVRILSEDEDEVESTPKSKPHFAKSPSALTSGSPEVPTSVLRSATKNFIPGLPVAGAAGLGLTQIFAGTMDDSQAGPASGSPMSMMPSFDNFPDSQFSQGNNESADNDVVVDSQRHDSMTQGVQINFSQSQMHGFDSLLHSESATQVSELIEPTQDCGFQAYSPLKQRFVEPPTSTLETMAFEQSQAGQAQQESPLVKKKGKLRRKMEAPALSDEEPQRMDTEELFSFDKSTTAFNVLKDAAVKERRQKTQAEFDKKKSKAKEMVEDQAEESEDEYAGLGGVDGEESDDSDAASVKEMIDDAAGNDIDEAKLAAFFADRERASDEKQVEKLFHDITTGMLRRKRGADYDLSDDEDGGEARRRMKRRQFAKMQRALFADERISKVAENPRNQAFLRSIEDRGSDDDMDFIYDSAPANQSDSSGESQPQSLTVPDSQPINTGAANKPLAAVPAAANRPPAAQRRTRDGKKPSNLGEIRESLSDLLEDPHHVATTSVIPDTDPASDSDADDEQQQPNRPSSSDKENRGPRGGRRRHRGGVAVVDRISLKRNGSSGTSAGSASGRLAFVAPAASSAGGSFKVPALLRRATTNSLMSNPSSTATTSGSTAGAGASGGFGDEAKIKKTAGKKSGVNFFARETERRAAVAESEKRREARKWKGAEGRVKAVGGLFGAGKFE